MCHCGKIKKKDWHLVCCECWNTLPEWLRNDLYHTYLMITHSPLADRWEDHHKGLIQECLDFLFPDHRKPSYENYSNEPREMS